MRFFLIAVLVLFSSQSQATYQVSISAIFQNEAPYLKEWIEFHKLVGVEHFWLYNNLSDDNYKEIIEPYIQDGTVELIEWPYVHDNLQGWNSIQCNAYNDAINRSLGVSKWLIVIDTDEFIFPIKCNSLSDFLNDYEDQVAIGVNWQMFGTSYVDRIKPGELLIEKLILKGPLNFHAHTQIKSIVRPEYVSYFNNPHLAILKGDTHLVNADKVVFKGTTTPYCSIDKIRINHYWLRDEFFMWNNKFPRRIKWSENTKDYEKQKKHWLKENKKMNKVKDNVIFKYVEELSKNISKRPV